MIQINISNNSLFDIFDDIEDSFKYNIIIIGTTKLGENVLKYFVYCNYFSKMFIIWINRISALYVTNVYTVIIIFHYFTVHAVVL